MTQKYLELINTFPKPGGQGAHQAIFKAGCLGCRAGLSVDTVVDDVQLNLPEGTRTVADSEIAQGVEAGFAAVLGGASKPRCVPSMIAPGTLGRIISEGRGATEADIRSRSPIPLDWPEHERGWRVLEALYDQHDLLFVSDDASPGLLGRTIRPAGEWVDLFRRQGTVPCPKIMVNPVTGRPAPKKSGVGQTLRGDACIAAHRFVVAEFDTLSIEDQLAFWMAVPHLPVAALIHSGKKSLHAWLRVDCVDHDEWETEIEGNLFPAYLQPLGLDPACKNASRLSRMPGHRRVDTGVVQRCLYLAPEGKAVCANE